MAITDQEEMEQRPKYESIRQLLHAARQSVSTTDANSTEEVLEERGKKPPDSLLTLAGFERSMGAGEYELAWLSLVSITGRSDSDARTWDQLARAASIIWATAEHLDRAYLGWVQSIVHEQQELRNALDRLATSSSNGEERLRARETLGLLFGQ